MNGRKKILIVGAGAREHAIASALAGADHDVLVAPGNGGTGAIARNVDVRVDDVAGLVRLAMDESVDLVVVGPELPLTLGLVDELAAHGIVAFGPSKEAARLEGSKAHMKQFCEKYGIRTAPFRVFTNPDEAETFVRRENRPLVVKADGLAAGKGVVVAATTQEALDAIDWMMRKRAFGQAGTTVVIEDLLLGEEASFHVVCDGERGLALSPAQDHKRVGDGDAGPNTGGMGAYAPAPKVTPALHAAIMDAIVRPTLKGMAAEKAPFRGVLFVGLMIHEGVATVLEFNVRFGDPETCVLVPLYRGDWFTLLDQAARGDLSSVEAGSREGSALCVVMAAKGYPASVRTGDVIHGLDVTPPAGAFVLHAGTRRREDGECVTVGGRVLTVGAYAITFVEARRCAYEAINAITWQGEHHRTDIGHLAWVKR